MIITAEKVAKQKQGRKEYKDDNVYNLVHQRRPYGSGVLKHPLDKEQYKLHIQSTDLHR